MVRFNNITKIVFLKNYIVVGFPRTLSQAQKLWEREKIDVALNLNVPYDVIIERVKGRWVHLPSGRVYNDDFNAPKVPVGIVFCFQKHF